MESVIKNLWYEKSFEEDLLNHQGDTVYVLRGTNKNRVSTAIAYETGWSVTKIKDLKPTCLFNI